GWDPGANASVYAIVLSGTGCYVGGGFSQVGGQPRRGLAQVDASGTVTAWSADVLPGYVRCMALDSGNLYLGGIFASVAGQARDNLAAVDAVTGAVTGWNPSPDGEVSSMAVRPPNGVLPAWLVVGGSFHSIGGLPRSRLAALDEAGNVQTW